MEPEKPATPGGQWRLDPQVVAERIGRDVVVVHLQTNKIFELNPTAARIFELMRGGADRTTLERSLLAEYEVAPEQLAASLDRLIGELRAARLLL